MSETVSLKEAAAQLGKSEKSVRRYLKLGWLEGQLVRTPSGERWLVTMPEDGVVHPPEVVSTAGHDAAPRVAALMPQNADLAPILAALSAIDAKQERILAELAALRGALLAELPAADTVAAHAEAPPPSERKRRWWHWLAWG